MTKELASFLTNLVELIKDWNAGFISTEEEFVFKLRKLLAEITPELDNQKEKKIQLKI